MKSIEKKPPLIWLDMEMTGLNPFFDHILEVAILITDESLNIYEEELHLVIHQPEEILKGMNDWCVRCHSESGLLEKVRSSNVTVEQAEEQILSFVSKYCEPEQSPLCGNSIEQDRRFIVRYMPSFDKFLNYRHVNVSSFKEMLTRWYPESPFVDFEKTRKHLALDDIRESIAELAHYRKHFLK
ncbi:oligoribonuclease [PVC group bacterium (ex Bugula neritina AB1)]|nr:oligoribonuclease [PVC group bacterium (ex Bugula neritina AB1)]